MRKVVIAKKWELLDGKEPSHKTHIEAARKKKWWDAVKATWKFKGGLKSLLFLEPLYAGTRDWKTSRKVAERNAILAVVATAINKNPALKEQLAALLKKGYTDIAIDKQGNLVVIKRRKLTRDKPRSYNLRRTVRLEDEFGMRSVTSLATAFKNSLPYGTAEALRRADMARDVAAERRKLNEPKRQKQIREEALRQNALDDAA
jgi:hypothetical protein